MTTKQTYTQRGVTFTARSDPSLGSWPTALQGQDIADLTTTRSNYKQADWERFKHLTKRNFKLGAEGIHYRHADHPKYVVGSMRMPEDQPFLSILDEGFMGSECKWREFTCTMPDNEDSIMPPLFQFELPGNHNLMSYQQLTQPFRNGSQNAGGALRFREEHDQKPNLDPFQSISQRLPLARLRDLASTQHDIVRDTETSNEQIIHDHVIKTLSAAMPGKIKALFNASKRSVRDTIDRDSSLERYSNEPLGEESPCTGDFDLIKSLGRTREARQMLVDFDSSGRSDSLATTALYERLTEDMTDKDLQAIHALVGSEIRGQTLPQASLRWNQLLWQSCQEKWKPEDLLQRAGLNDEDILPAAERDAFLKSSVAHAQRMVHSTTRTNHENLHAKFALFLQDDEGTEDDMAYLTDITRVSKDVDGSVKYLATLHFSY